MPQYKTVYYSNDLRTGYYTKTGTMPPKTPVMRLPYELKVEPTQLHQINCNAAEIIRGREKFKKGSFKFFTGLQETNFKQWFSGNDYEYSRGQKILSLCLFHFVNDYNRLTVFYFGRFYIDKREARERFTNDVIPRLLKEHFL